MHHGSLYVLWISELVLWFYGIIDLDLAGMFGLLLVLSLRQNM